MRFLGSLFLIKRNGNRSINKKIMRIRKGLKELAELKPCCQKNRGKAFRIIDDWQRLEPIDNVLYWHVLNVSPDQPKADILGAMEKGFSNWNIAFNAANLDIQYRPTSDINKAHVKCFFAVNGDNHLPYRFEDGVLAYALNDGRIFFNDDWNWTLGNREEGILLVKVHTHEIGHENLLDHSQKKGEIMEEYYNPNSSITQDSIDGILAVYPDFVRTNENDYVPPTEEQCKKSYITLRQSKSFGRLPKRSLQGILNGFTAEKDIYHAALVSFLLSEFNTRKDFYRVNEKTLLEMLSNLGHEYTDKLTKRDLYKLFHKSLDISLD